jgi:hypothetical protein
MERQLAGSWGCWLPQEAWVPVVLLKKDNGIKIFLRRASEGDTTVTGLLLGPAEGSLVGKLLGVSDGASVGWLVGMLVAPRSVGTCGVIKKRQNNIRNAALVHSLITM